MFFSDPNTSLVSSQKLQGSRLVEVMKDSSTSKHADNRASRSENKQCCLDVSFMALALSGTWRAYQEYGGTSVEDKRGDITQVHHTQTSTAAKVMAPKHSITGARNLCQCSEISAGRKGGGIPCKRPENIGLDERYRVSARGLMIVE